MPAFRGHFSVQGSAVGGLSYKAKKLPSSLISHRGAPCAIYEMKFRADRPDQTYLPLFPYST